ncbi:dTDP-4-dehydrorhamnose reductase [Vibrio splendidus]|nr:dTDP-4-dehydrorhamnose reductase [Vibrio splendidus]
MTPMNTKVKKIVVTGSNGQVGFLLSQKLEESNEFELYSFNRGSLDITSEQAVAKACESIKPDIIINCAAHTGVDKAETDIENSFAINEIGSRYLAEQALKHDALLIHISTDYVFDGLKQTPYIETDIPNPQCVYGKSKLAGELVIKGSGCKHVILRTAWVFGEHGNNFVKTMLKLGKEREELGIIGDQFGGPTYAGDIVNAVITIANKYSSVEQSGIYHFSGLPHVSWYGFAKQIFFIAEQKGIKLTVINLKKITGTQYPLPAPRPVSSCLNCKKIEDAFAITPSNWSIRLDQIKEYE